MREADFLSHRARHLHLADAKWRELPERRDAAELEQIARGFPADSVRSMSIFCRAPHAFPISGSDVWAMPLSTPEGLQH